MNLFKKYILPEQIDFFGKMHSQVELTQGLVDTVCDFYQNDLKAFPNEIENAFAKAEKNRKQALLDLNKTFITPVDKEAINRVYFQLNRTVLKVKHLITEMCVYNIFSLKDYSLLLDLLKDEMNLTTKGITLLTDKKYLEVHSNTDKLILKSNAFSKTYAQLLNILFQEPEQRKIFEHKEILFQLKDINHTLIDVNYAVEDIVFKMN